MLQRYSSKKHTNQNSAKQGKPSLRSKLLAGFSGVFFKQVAIKTPATIKTVLEEYALGRCYCTNIH
jgi:hypothetical protein